jgi:hypothetical protein
MVIASPIDEIVHCTVRIECQDAAGNISSGTGSFFEFNKADNGDATLCVVTNRHVMEGAVSTSFNLTVSTGLKDPKIGDHEKITISNPQDVCVYHPDPNVDLVALAVGPRLFRARKEGKEFFIMSIDRNLTADAEFLSSLSTMSEIAMVGYPIGLWDEQHNLPLVRRGVTSTHPKRSLNGRPEFLIDAACFPGSSGSPVFLANLNGWSDNKGNQYFGPRFKFLGCLWGGPVFKQNGEVINIAVPTKMVNVAFLDIPMNLGYVVNASKVWELEPLVLEFSKTKLNSRNSRCLCGSGQRYKACCGLV